MLARKSGTRSVPLLLKRSYSAVVFEAESTGIKLEPVPENIKTEQVTLGSVDATVESLETSFLKERLSPGDRRLVFAPTVNRNLGPLQMRSSTGKPLQKLEYPGLPSKSSLYGLIHEAQTPEALNQAREYILKYAKYENTAKNVEPGHLTAYIRAAAKQGLIKEAVHWTLANTYRFKHAATPEFYQDLLRITALALPYLSKRAVMNFRKTFGNAQVDGEPLVGSRLALLYGLVKHSQVFETAPSYSSVISELKTVASSDEFGVFRLHEVDVALGLEALRLAGETESDLYKKLEAVDAPTPEREDASLIYEVKKPETTDASS